MRQTKHPQRQLRQRVAVGLCSARHVLRRQRTARTGFILDHDTLPQMFTGTFGQRTQRDITAAAGRPCTSSVMGRAGYGVCAEQSAALTTQKKPSTLSKFFIFSPHDARITLAADVV